MDTVWILRYLYRVFHTFTLSAKLRMQMACQVLHSKWSSPKLMIGIQPPWLGCWNPRKTVTTMSDDGYCSIFLDRESRKKKKKPSKLPRLHPAGVDPSYDQSWNSKWHKFPPPGPSTWSKRGKVDEGVTWRCWKKNPPKHLRSCSVSFCLKGSNFRIISFPKNNTEVSWSGIFLKLCCPGSHNNESPILLMCIPYTLCSWMR